MPSPGSPEWWVGGREGTLSPWTLAKVWALVKISDKKGLELSASDIASEVEKVGGGQPWQNQWISRQQGPARDQGGCPDRQLDSENNWPVRPLMQVDATDLSPKCYMATLGRHFQINFCCQGKF